MSDKSSDKRDKEPTGPLTPAQDQRMHELLAKSKLEPGLSQEEHAELEPLHKQASAYARGWSADPEAASEASLTALEALTNALRMLAALVPVGHALDPILKQVDSALLASGHAMHKPEPVPEMPPPPSEKDKAEKETAEAKPSATNMPPPRPQRDTAATPRPTHP